MASPIYIILAALTGSIIGSALSFFFFWTLQFINAAREQMLKHIRAAEAISYELSINMANLNTIGEPDGRQQQLTKDFKEFLEFMGYVRFQTIAYEKYFDEIPFLLSEDDSVKIYSFYDMIKYINEMAYLGDPKIKEKGEKQIRYLKRKAKTAEEFMKGVAPALKNKIKEMRASPALLGPVERFYKKFPKFKNF